MKSLDKQLKTTLLQDEILMAVRAFTRQDREHWPILFSGWLTLRQLQVANDAQVEFLTQQQKMSHGPS